MILEVTNEELWYNLEEENTLHIILAYGAGCGPCANMKPQYKMVEDLFSNMNYKVKFYQIDVWNETNKEFKNKVPLEVVPTLVAYINGTILTVEKSYKDALKIREFVFTNIANARNQLGVEL